MPLKLERYLTTSMVNGLDLTVGKRPMLKTYSFTSDDDESVSREISIDAPIPAMRPPKITVNGQTVSEAKKNTSRPTIPRSFPWRIVFVVVPLLLVGVSLWTFTSTSPSVPEVRNATSLSTRSMILTSPTDFVAKLRRELKIRSRRNRTFVVRLSKVTGVKKETLFRFIDGKDLRSVRLHTFLSLLDFFQLVVLIVPK